MNPERQERVRRMVDENIRFVTDKLRLAGVPGADLDDEVQRTFIVAARRLDDVKQGAERAFLMQVAVNVSLHARRRLARRREVLAGDEALERIEALATPEHLTECKQMRELLYGILEVIPESERSVFTLYEVEQMTRTEIAAHLGVPRGTVASRLRRARVHFREQVAAIGLATYESVQTWRDEVSALERALLRVGTSKSASTATRAKTLAALGLNVLAAF